MSTNKTNKEYPNYLLSMREYVDRESCINGTRVSLHRDNAKNGDYLYAYFDVDGSLTEEYYLDFHGRDAHRVYHADGSYTERVYEPDIGKTLMYQYDANGNVIGCSEE